MLLSESFYYEVLSSSDLPSSVGVQRSGRSLGHTHRVTADVLRVHTLPGVDLTHLALRAPSVHDRLTVRGTVIICAVLVRLVKVVIACQAPTGAVGGLVRAVLAPTHTDLGSY